MTRDIATRPLPPRKGGVRGHGREHGYRRAGPARETYLNDPGRVEASELLTEISIPVVKA